MMGKTADNDVIETEIIEEIAQVETEAEAEASEQPEQAQAENEAQADDEVIVSIGEESPPQEEEIRPTHSWVKELRKKVQADIEKQQQEWQAKLQGYGKAKAELKVKDYDDAEGIVQESFNTTQQGVILQGADNPALLVYALGKNPKKAKELASISDPVKFAFAVAKLETQLKVTNRKAAPPPEKTVQGTGRISGSVDSTLDRLRADAEKSGDYSKVFAYKQQKRNK